jgi:ATP-dependent protease Clp ATPase subunit
MRWRKLACSFCGKDADAVERLVAGPRVLICDGCVARCNEILGSIRPEPLDRVAQSPVP